MAQAALGCVGVQRYTHKIRRHSAFFVTLLSDYNYQLNDNGVPKGSKRTTATPFLSSDNSKICISLARSDIRDISGIDLVIFKIEAREDTMTPLDHQAERTTRKKVYDSSSFYKKSKETFNRHRTEQIIGIIVSIEEKSDQQTQCRCSQSKSKRIYEDKSKIDLIMILDLTIQRVTDQQKNEVWRRSIKIPPKVENSNDHVELIVDNQPWTEWVSVFRVYKDLYTALGTG